MTPARRPDDDCTAAPAAHLGVRGLALARGGRWLFRDMTWAVPRGTFVAVTGPSGAGKSSLLACLAGLLAPDAGAVEYRGASGAAPIAPAAMRARIGLVFQQLMLTPNASVRSNVLCGRLGRYPAWRTALGFPRADRRAAQACLAALRIERHAHRPLAQLSGGEQQRVAVARALFQEPEVLLADEPVAHLDAALAEHVIALLARAARARGCSVVCVLHQPELVRRHADLALALGAADGAWTLARVAR